MPAYVHPTSDILERVAYDPHDMQKQALDREEHRESTSMKLAFKVLDAVTRHVYTKRGMRE